MDFLVPVRFFTKHDRLGELNEVLIRFWNKKVLLHQLRYVVLELVRYTSYTVGGVRRAKTNNFMKTGKTIGTEAKCLLHSVLI